MAHLKNITNRAYISNKLKNAMKKFEQYRYTFISAPTGYGKSIVCRTFFRNYPGYTVLWIDANSTKELFWNNLCNAIKLLSPSYAVQFMNIGFPKDKESVNKLINIISVLNNDHSSAILVIDNFDKIFDDNIAQLFSSTYASSAIGFKYVFILHELHNHDMINLVSKNEAGLIDSKDLAFDSEDIYDYFKLNEVLIDKEKASEIYNKTLGWPYIVQIFMREHNNDDKRVILDKACDFIDNNIWFEYDEDLRNFLIQLSVFNEFNINQCIGQTLLDEKKCLEYLSMVSLISYDEHYRLYRFNPIFKEFLSRILNEKPSDVVNNIILRAADTYHAVGNYYYAIKLYASAKEYDKIYLSDADFRDIYGHIIKDNKELFLDIANHYWDVKNKGNYKFSLIILFTLLIYNERNIGTSLFTDIKNDVKNDDNLNESKKSAIYAELEYIRAFSYYNDFSKMNEIFKIIPSITKSPVNIIAGQFPFNFECPSIMSMYHRKSGSLDVEMLTLDDCAPNYYRITNGHGKGYEALMRAEVLYNRGEFEGAEILCHKAVYMADSRNQYSIYISANYLLALISIYNGANDAYKEYLNNINKLINSEEFVPKNLRKMADLCKSMIYCDLKEKDKVANWLRDEKGIEDNTNFLSLSFANILYGKYLIITEDYHHFLGISGQLLGLTKVFSTILPRLYIYIYLCIANSETGDTDKARKFMLEALELAVHDKIIMPFVHNYSYISELLEETVVSKNLAAFVKSIQKVCKSYEKGVKTIKKAGRILANYGLTVREADVAKLAAMRLSNKEIAEQLFIAESTVKSNMKVIFNKLQINSRSELKNFFE